MKVKRNAAAVAVVIAAFVLAGCATPATPGAAAEQTGSNRPAATTAETSVELEPEVTADEPVVEETTPASDEPVAFGSTKTYEDGLAVTVSKGKSFRPSDTSAGGDKFKYAVKYTITVVNGTGKTFDPSMFSATAQSGNVEGDRVYDSAEQIGGGPDTKLLKGREAKFSIGFGISDLKDVVLEVSPSYERDSILFN
jgi:hypothetical protein